MIKCFGCTQIKKQPRLTAREQEIWFCCRTSAWVGNVYDGVRHTDTKHPYSMCRRLISGMSVHYVIGVFVIAITVYCLAITRLRWDNLKLIKKIYVEPSGERLIFYYLASPFTGSIGLLTSRSCTAFFYCMLFTVVA